MLIYNDWKVWILIHCLQIKHKGVAIEKPTHYDFKQEHIKMGGGGEEHVTAHPGCGPGGMVGLCLNILFTV